MTECGAFARARGALRPSLRSAFAAFGGCLAALVLFALPSTASAARFRPCPGRPDVQCGRVVVPFDQTGVVRGALSLHVERMHTHGSANGAMIALAGALRLAAGQLQGPEIVVRPRWDLETLPAI